MTNFFGSCTACTIGKLHNADLHTTSLSPPSTTVGQCIFFDFQLLTTPSVGGNTQAIIAIDDRSGFLSVLGSKSKVHHDVMIPIEQLIATTTPVVTKSQPSVPTPKLSADPSPLP